MQYFIHVQSEVFTLIRDGQEIPQHIQTAMSINGKKFNDFHDMEKAMDLDLYTNRIPNGGVPYNIITPTNMCKLINLSQKYFPAKEGHAFAVVDIAERTPAEPRK